MKLETVKKNKIKENDTRGRPNKYKELYDRIEKMEHDEAVKIINEDEDDLMRTYNSVRYQGYDVKKRGNTLIVTK